MTRPEGTRGPSSSLSSFLEEDSNQDPSQDEERGRLSTYSTNSSSSHHNGNSKNYRRQLRRSHVPSAGASEVRSDLGRGQTVSRPTTLATAANMAAGSTIGPGVIPASRHSRSCNCRYTCDYRESAAIARIGASTETEPSSHHRRLRVAINCYSLYFHFYFFINININILFINRIINITFINRTFINITINITINI